MAALETKATLKRIKTSLTVTDLSGCEVTLFFGFENLPSLDLFSKSDPFAEVSIFVPKKQQWVNLGKTEYIQDQNTGQWSKNFDCRFVFEEQQKINVKVYDYDSLSSHDYIGEATFFLGNVMGNPGQSMKVKLFDTKARKVKQRGALIVHAEDKKDSLSGAKLVLGLKGHKLEKKDWFGLKSSDPYFLIERNVNGNWIKVYQSEYLKNNSSPVWKRNTLSLDKICRGKLDDTIKLSVLDYNENSTHDLIGEAVLTVNELLAAQQNRTHIQVKHPPTKKKYQKASYQHSGLIEVVSAFVVPNPTDAMLKYIAGGVQLNLVVAVDFTASNGDPRNPRSLHFHNPNQDNQYQAAIKSVGDILLAYDTDGCIPAFGFGGSFGGKIEHCFPLNGNLNDARVQGVSGLLSAYDSALLNVPLSGPTYFGPLIKVVNSMAHNPELSQANQTYTTLLILTDGVINDMNATLSQIVQGSSNPLSIVIVGVGNADFAQMDRLDGDDALLVDPNTNRRAARDIVQFVPFNKFQGNGAALAREVLAEIPEQFVQFFNQRKIKPNAPLRAPTLMEAVSSVEQHFASAPSAFATMPPVAECPSAPPAA